MNSYDYNAGGRLSDVKTLTPQYKNFKYEYNKGVLEKIRFEDEFEQNYVIPVKKNMGDKIVEAGKKLRSIFF